MIKNFIINNFIKKSKKYKLYYDKFYSIENHNLREQKWNEIYYDMCPNNVFITIENIINFQCMNTAYIEVNKIKTKKYN